MLNSECLQVFGAGSLDVSTLDSADTEGDCKRQAQNYRDCLTVAATCGEPATTTTTRCTSEDAASLFGSAEKANDCIGYQAFIDACPNSPQAVFARAGRERLACDGSASGATASAPVDAEPVIDLIPAIQTELKRLGLYRYSVDGDWGPGSRVGLRAFQDHIGVTADGEPSQEVLEQLTRATTAEVAPAAAKLTAQRAARAQSATAPAARTTQQSAPASAAASPQRKTYRCSVRLIDTDQYGSKQYQYNTTFDVEGSRYSRYLKKREGGSYEWEFTRRSGNRLYFKINWLGMWTGDQASVDLGTGRVTGTVRPKYRDNQLALDGSCQEGGFLN